MPYTISLSENPVAKFGKAFLNRLVYRPDIVLKDSLYAAAVVYVMDMTFVPDLIGNVASTFAVNSDTRAAIGQGLTFATIKNLEYALAVSMA